MHALLSAGRRQLPPEDFNIPDLSYAMQPSGFDENGNSLYQLFRYILPGLILCVEFFFKLVFMQYGVFIRAAE